ncbi:PE/PPE C-terminal domain-containing protein [Mycobacterium intracellulare]|nr:PE/PPE C-terminal domain-containing protein [Mycobacterium intracellulare]MCA2312177.1 PE/PPE C-terminal domain-containing protein [Mycobacterium intracellulare subsp. chimaera]MCA2354627.1 PE/PPE C-terminal domain-containing protein [Mycobacterium intracellulare subsp. chimaera]MCV7327031.1 PE/PPE C-terminal domain-containing protein [Mycobacterium intracellulare subsp. chimaera]QGK51693.1 hypothetical protein GJE02_14340 [Mycobacterium intracellulare subsp. chimaera]
MSMTSSVGWISSALLSNANQVKNLMPAVGAASTASGSSLTGGLASGLTGALGSGALGSTGSPGLGGAAVSAGMGRAGTVGALSVPQTWAAAAPAISPTATALPATSLAAAPGVGASGPGSLLGAPLAGLAGRGPDSATTVADTRFLPRPTIVPHWSESG